MTTEDPTTRIAQAREAGGFTDFAFTCQGKTFPVHRIIVCSQSTVLHDACAKKWEHASSRVYSMDSHPLPIVERLVEYLYTGDYSDDASAAANGTTSSVNILSIHARMCIMAEKYGVQGLAELATGKYGWALQNLTEMKYFLSSLNHVYQTSKPDTPKDQTGPCLRDWAVAFTRDQLPAHLSDPKFKRAFDWYLARNSEYMRDLLYSALEHPLIGVCFSCGPVMPADNYHCRCRDCMGVDEGDEQVGME